jgi:multiple sugar transport system ATP-binding protein
MQVGTPDEIYHHPVSRFVAGFTGSPPMNFLKGTLAVNHASVTIMVGESALAIPASLCPELLKMNGRAVEFGIRPEDISLEAYASDDAELAVKVVVVEPLGAETLVTFQCGAGELVARLPPATKLTPGEQVTLCLNMDKMHLFDTEDGSAIGIRQHRHDGVSLAT